MLDALDDLEPEAIGLRLDQAFALLRVDETFEAVIAPAARDGRRALGSAATMTTAEEHLVSEAVRSRLGHLLARCRRRRARRRGARVRARASGTSSA